MKKMIIMIMILSLGLNYCHAQDFKYEIGAFSTNGLNFKFQGFLEVKDSLCTLSSKIGEESKYNVVNIANNTTYITDGFMTHYFTIKKIEGKKKGYQYNYQIFFFMDNRSQGAKNITYYCNKIE